MGTAIILVAVAAAIGVGLVVFGTVRSQQAASPQESVRASYRTLADVREQLRRRFDPTGTPTWIASDDRTSKQKSTRLNSSHDQISYAVFCLKTKINLRG